MWSPLGRKASGRWTVRRDIVRARRIALHRKHRFSISRYHCRLWPLLYYIRLLSRLPARSRKYQNIIKSYTYDPAIAKASLPWVLQVIITHDLQFRPLRVNLLLRGDFGMIEVDQHQAARTDRWMTAIKAIVRTVREIAGGSRERRLRVRRARRKG